MTRLSIAPLLVSLLLAAPASAAPTARDFDAVLGGVERRLSATDLRRLGAAPDQALIAYAEDPHTSRVRRMRAILALRFAPSVSARAYLHDLLGQHGRATTGADVLDVAAAIGALSPYGREELATLLPYLSHASADVRQNAAASLAALHEPDALGPLAARLTIERDSGVRFAIAGALRTIQPFR